jgi:hypothetical protein
MEFKLKRKAKKLIGKPIGIDFEDGTGNSGVLADVDNEQIYVVQYMYWDMFATKHYELKEIKNIHEFPKIVK